MRAGGARRGANVAVVTGIAAILLLGMFAAVAPAARAAGPCDETAYANGRLFCIHITRIITTPSDGLLRTAEPVYLTSYFPLPAGCDTSNPSTCGPETLPSGVQPLCNPCFHGGALDNFPYHDHVLEGAPGFGTGGTSDGMKGPWVLILMVYVPSYSNAAGFTPFKSAADIDRGETAGAFQMINPNGENPFELNTGVVVIFGVQPLN